MTHYEILGVEKNATQKEIRTAYKNLIKKYHPDLYQGDKVFAEKKTQDINNAYDILSNPSSRAIYDEQITPKVEYKYTEPKYSTPESYTKYYQNIYNYKSSYNYQKKANYSYNNSNNSYYNHYISYTKIKFITAIIIISIYVILFWSSYVKIKKAENENMRINYNNYYRPNQEMQNKNKNRNENYEEFDINDYITDEELREYYNSNNFKEKFGSFEEFKKYLSEYLSEVYY